MFRKEPMKMFQPMPDATAKNLALLLLCCWAAPLTLAQAPRPACPPATAVKVVHDTYGTVDVADPYRWLEDQQSPETRGWIAEQQACTAKALSPLPGRAAISKRLSELLHTDRLNAPTERGGRYFFTKRLANEDLAKIYVRRGSDGADEVLVDPLPWSKDHSTSATIEAISKDGKLLFYGRREGGQDEVTVHVLDVDRKTDLPDSFPRADYFSVEATPDNKGVYYVRTVEGAPRAYYHAMGTDSGADKVIYGDNLGKDRILVAGLSDDGRYLV
jgi:prolyl oligopeptidase